MFCQWPIVGFDACLEMRRYVLNYSIPCYRMWSEYLYSLTKQIYEPLGFGAINFLRLQCQAELTVLASFVTFMVKRLSRLVKEI